MAGFVSLCVSIALILQGCLAQHFRDSPANSLALTTYPFTLSCSAPDPTPPFTITWFHNAMAASSDSRINITYNMGTGGSQYVISRVNYFDAGTYHCVAMDAQGQTVSTSATGTLTVQGRPAFSASLPAVDVSSGESAVFTCSVVSNPPATVSWASGTPPQTLSSNGRITISNTTLTINNVQAVDEGFYECIAVNSFGQNSTSGRLTITAPTDPLDVSITPSAPSPYPLTLGDSLLLRCRATGGRGTPSFSWQKDSTVVTENVTRDSDGSSLSITSAQAEDEGTYTCLATSPGSSTVSAMLSVVVYIPPMFRVLPGNATIRAGLSLTANCEATGTPSPTITWLRPNGEVVMVIGGAPQFGTLQRSDAGVYACVANNLAGERRAEFTITVQDIPLITEPPQNVVAGYGQDPVFRCVAVGPPAPNITWSKTGSAIQMGHVTTTNELHLFSITDSDRGTYQCTADNGLGTATASATLSIQDPPTVQFISPTTSLEIGNSFTLNCTTSDPQSTTLRWYHNGTLLPSPSTPGVRISPSGLLTVFNAALSHSGEYTCNASTSYAYRIARVTVIVGTAPQITAGPSNTDLGPGGQVFLNCVVAGLPLPQTTWYKTDLQGSRSELQFVGDTFTVHTQGLQLRNVTRNDTGTYECQARNVLGSSTQRATVRVEGVPLATNITPTLLIAGNMATLTCNTLYNFPAPMLSWARVDGTPFPIGRFFIGANQTFNFSPVQGEDEGEYMCTATNAYGASNVISYVTVHVPPAVIISPAQPVAILDSTQILRCSVVGRPVPSIQWTLPDGSNPVDISTISNPQIIPLIPYSFDRTTGELRISRIKAADAGLYSCMASSIVGTANLQVDLIVRGAAPLNATVTLRRPTVLGFMWDLPPPELSDSLTAFQIEFGLVGSRDRVVTSRDKNDQRLYSQVQLEEDSSYEFIVRGLYEGGVVGVDAVVIATTLEDAPSAAPQNITLVSLEEALAISWVPPDIQHQNGAITHYNIYFSQSPDASNPTPAFTLIIYSPEINSSADSNFTRILDNLLGGQLYDVKLQAATAVGPGPNSTVFTSATLRPFPLTLILSITVPVGTVLLAIVLLVLCGLCILCLRRRSQRGKHTPLMEEHGFQKQKKKKLRQKTISGPIPGITPHIDSSVPGKFTVQAKDGTVLSLNPKVIMEDDVAPPPVPGQRVQQVPRERIMRSQDQEGSAAFNPYSTPADSLKAAGVDQRLAANARTPPAAGIQQRPAANNQLETPPPSVEGARPTSNIYSEPVVVVTPPPSAAGQEKPRFHYADDIDPYAVHRMVQPIPEVPEEEDQEEEEEEGGEEGEGLSSSRNVLNLSSQEDAITPAPPATPTPATPPTATTPPTPPPRSEPAFETTRDDVELLYSTVSHEHKVKKRKKMIQQQQKREMKARQDQRKMQEKMRREQKKREVKARQHSEKELKRRRQEDDRRQELGLGNVVRLHDLDLSSQKGRAQAQFIDAATAAIF